MSLLSSVTHRVYIDNDTSYPSDESLETRSLFIDVLSNLMGDYFEAGMIQWAEEIEAKLRVYKQRLEKEEAAYRAHPNNKCSNGSGLFTLDDLKHYDKR